MKSNPSSQSSNDGLSLSEKFWVGVMVLFAVGFLAVPGWFLVPKIVDAVTPPTPTPEPGRQDIRQLEMNADLLEACVDMNIGEGVVLSDGTSQNYVYSAMLAAVDNDLVPGIEQRDNLRGINFYWIQNQDGELRYVLSVEGVGAFEFSIFCHSLLESGFWLVFDQVEVLLAE